MQTKEERGRSGNKANSKACVSMQMTRLWVHILVVHSIGIYVYADTHTLGDPEKDDKSGLYILCKVFSKESI